MQLYEHEGKQLLEQYKISTPKLVGVFSSAQNLPSDLQFPVVAKVLVLQGKRGKRGGVKIINSHNELTEFFEQNLISNFYGEIPAGIVIEQRVGDPFIDYYFSISYNSEYQGPVIIVNSKGGVDVESSKESVIVIPVNVIDKKIDNQAQVLGKAFELTNQSTLESLNTLIANFISCFFEQDCQQIEINPLRLTADEKSFIAVDCKLTLDSRANYRHPDRNFSPRLVRQPTKREIKIKEVNSRPEYKGSPCRYVELDGDVAVLLSGGGASVVVFDALIAGGIKPGNYSEYSGNPTREKVEALTRIILSKPNQNGLLIAGGVANFTLIDETMAGIAAALGDIKPNYPIVIRRGGPNEQIGEQIMMDLAKKHNLNITWLGLENSLEKAAQFFIAKIKEKTTI